MVTHRERAQQPGTTPATRTKRPTPQHAAPAPGYGRRARKISTLIRLKASFIMEHLTLLILGQLEAPPLASTQERVRLTPPRRPATRDPVTRGPVSLTAQLAPEELAAGPVSLTAQLAPEELAAGTDWCRWPQRCGSPWGSASPAETGQIHVREGISTSGCRRDHHINMYIICIVSIGSNASRKYRYRPLLEPRAFGGWPSDRPVTFSHIHGPTRSPTLKRHGLPTRER